ncbi:MAG TPA: hypothetical protein [Caudoviricetes sp.]|nr:MAG TPA: hypothetical protein [Caudoviricetes sp.]
MAFNFDLLSEIIIVHTSLITHCIYFISIFLSIFF